MKTLKDIFTEAGDDFLHLVHWQAGSTEVDGELIERPWEALGKDRVAVFGKTPMEAMMNLLDYQKTKKEEAEAKVKAETKKGKV